MPNTASVARQEDVAQKPDRELAGEVDVVAFDKKGEEILDGQNSGYRRLKDIIGAGDFVP